MSAIEVDRLRKEYGSFTAVDNISFQVNRGEVFGFLGPNGAGKTTTIKMLTTLLPPTSGHARVLGLDIARQGRQIRSRIGVVQQAESYEYSLRVEDALELYGLLWNVPKLERRRRVEALLEAFELQSHRRHRSPELSIGLKRRLQVAREFMHDMDLLFLDEPTLGLDPIARRATLDMIRSRVREGLTVFFTTHILEEAEYICDRIAIIHQGRIVAVDTPQGLKDRFGGLRTIEAVVDGGDVSP
ncbi:MAG: ABC transporter ATP-binding protein, partial [Candidatus Bathyarchaeia archaeon]